MSADMMAGIGDADWSMSDTRTSIPWVPVYPDVKRRIHYPVSNIRISAITSTPDITYRISYPVSKHPDVNIVTSIVRFVCFRF
jgi:hypothetical protein